MEDKKRPSEEALINLTQTEWADIRHSRVQEWTALGVVAGAHLVLVQITNLTSEDKPWMSHKEFMIVSAIIAAAFAILGILMTFRHRHLMKVKLGWIYQAEEQLGLVHDQNNPNGIIPRNDDAKEKLSWPGMRRPRLLSTSGLIVGFYGLLIIVDFLVAYYFGFS